MVVGATETDPTSSGPRLSILIHSIYYDASATGIAKYTAELAEWLAARGHRVEVITTPPHYPSWRIASAYRGVGYKRERLAGVDVCRTPLYVPAADRLSGRRRILYEASFAVNGVYWWLRALLRRPRHDLVVAVCPSLQSAWMPWVYATLRRVPWLLHVQDLQVDTALRLGIIGTGGFGRVMYELEAFLMGRATSVSTITEAMRQRIVAKGVLESRTVLFPNWSDVGFIRPLPRGNELRRGLGVPLDHTLFVYAGNMGAKQGLELILAAADRLRHQSELHLALVGDGAVRAQLQAEAARLGLPRLHFLPLQPVERLPELLAAADVHLVVQKREAADLVMPSKLVNVLAAGRPTIATADPGTALHAVLADHATGLVTPPGDVHAFVRAMTRLHGDPGMRTAMGRRARAFAERHFDKERILLDFEAVAARLALYRPGGRTATEQQGAGVS